jgi:phosphatidate cytidylyltransferase
VKSNLTIRVLTSVVALPLLFGLLFLAPERAWFLFLLVVTGLTAFELFAMSSGGDRMVQLCGVLATGIVFCTAVFLRTEPRLALLVLVLLPILSLLPPLFRPGPIEKAGLRLMTAVGGPYYLGALLSPLVLLRQDGGVYGPWWVFLLLAVAWLGDTGAYFTGRAFGKKKLYPLVSPNKTWAGLYGAVGAGGLGALLVSFAIPSLPALHAVGLGLVAGLLGQLGDLAESLLKRSAGVKDSGTIIPGHGGLFDRIDALLFVAPVIYAYTLVR